MILIPTCCVLQVEEVFENLCVLTHHHDHFQHLSGQIIKGATHEMKSRPVIVCI